jgi:lipopolysaccharide export system permease protein
VVFFTSKMAMKSEIIAIIGNGISFNRLLYPYFISALILAIVSYGLSNFVIPPANKVRLDFENTYINGTYYNSDRNIHKQVSPGIFIYMENFNTISNTGNRFTMEKFDGNNLISKMYSRKIKWDTTIEKWKATDFYIREIEKNSQRIRSGKTIDTSIFVTPADFQRRDSEKSSMDMVELNRYIEDIKLRGETNVNTYLLEKYQRTAFPLSTFILTLIGVSLASRKSKGGTGLKMGLGFLISFLYIFFMQIAAQFSIKGGLSPFIAAWIPNLIFMVIAVFLYRIAPK